MPAREFVVAAVALHGEGVVGRCRYFARTPLGLGDTFGGVDDIVLLIYHLDIPFLTRREPCESNGVVLADRCFDVCGIVAACGLDNHIVDIDHIGYILGREQGDILALGTIERHGNFLPVSALDSILARNRGKSIGIEQFESREVVGVGQRTYLDSVRIRTLCVGYGIDRVYLFHLAARSKDRTPHETDLECIEVGIHQRQNSIYAILRGSGTAHIERTTVGICIVVIARRVAHRIVGILFDIRVIADGRGIKRVAEHPSLFLHIGSTGRRNRIGYLRGQAVELPMCISKRNLIVGRSRNGSRPIGELGIATVGTHIEVVLGGVRQPRNGKGRGIGENDRCSIADLRTGRHIGNIPLRLLAVRLPCEGNGRGSSRNEGKVDRTEAGRCFLDIEIVYIDTSSICRLGRTEYQIPLGTSVFAQCLGVVVPYIVGRSILDNLYRIYKDKGRVDRLDARNIRSHTYLEESGIRSTCIAVVERELEVFDACVHPRQGGITAVRCRTIEVEAVGTLFLRRGIYVWVCRGGVGEALPAIRQVARTRCIALEVLGIRQRHRCRAGCLEGDGIGPYTRIACAADMAYLGLILGNSIQIVKMNRRSIRNQRICHYGLAVGGEEAYLVGAAHILPCDKCIGRIELCCLYRDRLGTSGNGIYLDIADIDIVLRFAGLGEEHDLLAEIAVVVAHIGIEAYRKALCLAEAVVVGNCRSHNARQGQGLDRRKGREVVGIGYHADRQFAQVISVATAMSIERHLETRDTVYIYRRHSGVCTVGSGDVVDIEVFVRVA